jgi:hypothetical protein
MNLEELYAKYGKLVISQKVLNNEINAIEQQIGNVLNSIQKAQDKPDKEEDK